MANLIESLRQQRLSNQPRLKTTAGSLGIKLGGSEVVSVPGRPGYVYVRLLNTGGELIQAYNSVVSPIYDLPVLVTWDVNRYKIQGRDTIRYQNWGDTAYLPIHGNQHTFDRTGEGGGDLVWVMGEQFYPLAAIPSGTVGSNGVTILPYVYNWNNTWKHGGNTGSANALAAKPTTPGTVRLLLLCLNGQTSNPFFVTGSEVLDTLSEYELVDYYPTVDMSTSIPIAIIKLETGTSAIGWDNIYDVRQFFGGGITTGSSGSGSSAISYHDAVVGASDPGADPPGFGAGPLIITEDGNQSVWRITTSATPPSAVYVQLPVASESNKLITLFYNDTDAAKSMSVYDSAGNQVLFILPNSAVQFFSDGTNWRSVSDPTVVREGTHLKIGASYPTTSKIYFGYQYLYIHEPSSDRLAINAGGTFAAPLNVFEVGWDDAYEHIFAKIGDIDNQDHGRYVTVDEVGVRIVGGLPTGTAGLSAGHLWNDGGIVKIVS